MILFLEPERTLLLAEKGVDLNSANNSDLIVAKSNFCFIGTMNPAGDFGKKELSPALRNRFTEIWCEPCMEINDLIDIIECNIKKSIFFDNQDGSTSGLGKNIMEFICWFRSTEIGKRFTISIRDILTWVNFMNSTAEKINLYDAYVHGACLTFLDSLGSGVTSTDNTRILQDFRNTCMQFLKNQLKKFKSNPSEIDLSNFEIEKNDNVFGIKPFYVGVNPEGRTDCEFSFDTPTTTYNALRILRGMQLQKAILLEGSPGVGKTSLVTALAKITGHQLFRVNLSDQTVCYR